MAQPGWLEAKLENGETLAAPNGMWIVALLEAMPLEQRNKVLEKVASLMQQTQSGVVLAQDLPSPNGMKIQ